MTEEEFQALPFVIAELLRDDFVGHAIQVVRENG
jgi:hypothetical protein